MQIEHIGISVEDPMKMAKWYQNNLNCIIKLQKGDKNRGVAFISDKSNSILIELFSLQEVKKYKADLKNPLKIHIAFSSKNIEEDMQKLINNGAIFIEECNQKLPGDQLYLLKDPWNNVIQLVQRKTSLL